jgi:hypothetical protein
VGFTPRSLLEMWFVSALVAVISRDGPDELDPYHIRFIDHELRVRAGVGKGVSGFSAKQLQRFGDASSIAIIKILGHEQLIIPEVASRVLPIIDLSFSYPELIARETDKHPKVTLLLLAFLIHQIPDPEIQKNIQQTREFVLSKTMY